MKRFVFALVLAAGCSNANNEANNTTGSTDVAPLVERVAAVQCEKILECCAANELEQVFGANGATDQASCEQAITTQAAAFLKPALERSLADGTAGLQEAAIDGCIAALDQRGCADFEPSASADVLRHPGCEDIVLGKLTLSGFCQDDFECDTGFCSRPPDETEGTCKNAPLLDDPCLNDRCDAGLVCGPDDTCVEKLGDGELCARNADCLSDLCSPNQEGELVCVSVAEICTGS
jgi:hypothetical protein